MSAWLARVRVCYSIISSRFTTIVPKEYLCLLLLSVKLILYSEGESSPETNFVALKNCAAHVACKVEKIDADSDREHLILFCSIAAGYVKQEYWSGKQIYPQSPELPGLLSFLGSQKFVEMRPID